MTDAAALTKVGTYELKRKLGEGGMGTVYLAQHTLLRRRAALKLLHPKYSHDPAIVERFFNEARAATSIADPGIVQIFDFGYEGTTAFIVMEFLEGESLDARLARLGKIPAQDVVRLSRQLALSLYAAHQQGVIHRDLKPENILVVPDPEVTGGERTKILDFGIAKLMDTEVSRVRTQTGMMMGTPLYMSPEQCRGASSVDHRSDIYSLGCVIFHLLTGRVVFDADGTGELIVAHITQPAPPPSQYVAVSPAIDALVAKCLEKEPEARFQTMRELAVALDDVLKRLSEPGVDHARLTPIPTATPAPTIVAAAQKKRWPLIVGGIAIAAIAAGGALLLTKSPPEPPAPVAQPPPVIESKPESKPDPKPEPTHVELQAVAPPPVIPDAAVPAPVATSKPAPHKTVVKAKPTLHGPEQSGSTPPVVTPTKPPADPYDDR